MQNYGEHILKTLIARSPKLPHARRLSNPLAPPLTQNGHGSGGGGGGGGSGGGSPRQGGMATRQDLGGGGRPRRFGSGGGSSIRGGMLHPPHPFPLHGFLPMGGGGGNPANSFYGVGINHGQLSPPNAAALPGNSAITPPGNAAAAAALGGYPGGGVVLHVPPGGGGSTPHHHHQTSPQVGGGGGGGSGTAGNIPGGQLMYVQSPPMGVVAPPPPTMGSPGHPLTTRPSSPVLSAAQSTDNLAKSTEGGGVGTEMGVYLPPMPQQQQQQQQQQTQGVLSSLNPLLATSAVPLSVSSGAQQPLMVPGGGRGGATAGQYEQQQQQQQVLAPPNGMSPGSVFPLADSAAVVGGGVIPPPANQFHPQMPHPPLPGAAAPPPHVSIGTPHHALAVSASHTSQGGGGGGGVESSSSEPLLPNPPLPSVPLLPMAHPIPTLPPTGPPLPPGPATARQVESQGSSPAFPSQHGSPLSSRKEILCRHYMQGNCTYGDKCWFAHPEPPPFLFGGGGGGGGGASPQSRPPEGVGTNSAGLPPPPPAPPGGRIPNSGPLNAQLPPSFWLNSPLMDFAAAAGAMASPPHSPLNPALGVPSPLLPSMFRPRGGGGGGGIGGGGGGAGGLTAAQQQSLMFLRGPLPGLPRIPGTNLPLLQPTPFIPPVANPILSFELLSQVAPPILPPTDVGKEGASAAMGISQLATFADHFFVSRNSTISTYKIIFGGGGNRSFQVRVALLDSALNLTMEFLN